VTINVWLGDEAGALTDATLGLRLPIWRGRGRGGQFQLHQAKS